MQWTVTHHYTRSRGTRGESCPLSHLLLWPNRKKKDVQKINKHFTFCSGHPFGRQVHRLWLWAAALSHSAGQDAFSQVVITFMRRTSPGPRPV